MTCNHDMEDGDALKREFRRVAQATGITDKEFEQVVFAFAKDRIENWIEFLRTGSTDESKEGPRLQSQREAADAAKALATRCASGTAEPALPPSLAWSCRNWHRLVDRMRQ